ncbi:MAG TPA: DEAD/DEAH box helicase, partial [Spirochaetales bacterium]|nr:DEAD/DEAH box helicase [Spirochaetales bacterium]
AARGIDVDDITHVFNFDQPTEPETYVHRIGRTARAGASGTAISFCDTEEKKFLRQVERLLGKPIPVVREHPWATGSGRAGESREEADTDDRPRNRPSGQARLGYGQTKSRQGASRQGAFAGIGKPRRGQSGRQFGGKPASSVERPGSQAKTGQRSKDGSAQPAAARRDDKPSVRQVEQRPSGGEHRSQKPIDTGSSGRKDIRSAINELTGRGKR